MDPSSHTRYLRDSISTLDSEFSNTAASSIFSIARSNSRASTNTAYSDHSLPSAISYSSFDSNSHIPPSGTIDSGATIYGPCRAASGRIHDDPRRAALRAATQQATLRVAPPVPAPTESAASRTRPVKDRQVNKLSNKFACSHCPETFSKKSDRKKHWQGRCQYLGDPNTAEASPGDGFVCPSCDYVARNGHQQRNHQHHHSSWEPIRLSARERFTCSNHGNIFRSAREFYAHFDRDDCPLNRHSGGNDGYRHHQSRIITLLEEGRDNLRGNHTYLFAALSTYCDAHGLHKDDWRGIVQRHSADDALALANKLEWGLQRPDGSTTSRLGFTDLFEMVAQAVPLHYALDRPLNMSNAGAGRKLPSYQTAASFPLPDNAEWLSSELSNARFVRRIEENAAQTAMFRPPLQAEQQAEVHQDIGLAILQPRSRSASRPLQSPKFDPESDVHHDPFGLYQHVEFEASWPYNSGFMAAPKYQDEGVGTVSRSLPNGYCQEMAVRHDAPSLFLPRSTHIDNPRNADQDQCYLADSLSMVAHYPERAALTPSPPPPVLSVAKKKRPISKNSAVLADSVVRSKSGPMQSLAHRPAFMDSPHNLSMADPVSSLSSKRGSGDSMSRYIDRKAYEEPPTPTMLLPGTKAASYDDRAMTDAKSSFDRSRTPAQVVTDALRKMTDPTPREMDAEAAQELIPIPRNSASASQCVHCGKINDIGCLTRHIGCQAVSRNRRQGSVLDPAEVAQALRSFHQGHEHWLLPSGNRPNFD